MKRIALTAGILVLLAGTSAWAQTEPRILRRELERVQYHVDDLHMYYAQNVPVQPRAATIVPPRPVETIFRSGDKLITLEANDPLASLQVAPGTWWNDGDTVASLSLTKDQQRKMDDIFQQHRLKLIDLNAALAKEEAILDPLIAAERLDEVKVLTQVDRIAQARAELEKANSRMLLAIRQSLTMEQWTKIQSLQRPKKR